MGTLAVAVHILDGFRCARVLNGTRVSAAGERVPGRGGGLDGQLRRLLRHFTGEAPFYRPRFTRRKTVLRSRGRVLQGGSRRYRAEAAGSRANRARHRGFLLSQWRASRARPADAGRERRGPCGGCGPRQSAPPMGPVHRHRPSAPSIGTVHRPVRRRSGTYREPQTERLSRHTPGSTADGPTDGAEP